jgi:LacI family transcriptional regulator
VLNGARGNIRVSAAKRHEIQQAAEALGYQPHRGAQALRRQSSKVIGFVPRASWATSIDEVIPYAASSALGRSALRRGHHIIEANAESPEQRAGDETLRLLQSWRVAGVIMDSPSTDEEVRRVVDAGIPIVQLFRPRPGVATSTVTVAPEAGMRQALDHLIESGHRRIAYLGAAGLHPVDTRRLAAFREALRYNGIEVPGNFIQLTETYYSEDGASSMRALLEMDKSRWPTAIVAGGDPLALGALQVLHQARVRVPDEMSIVSYDDAIAGFFVPTVTSIAQPFDEVAEQALALLTEPDGQDTIRHCDVPSRLLVRESVVRLS